jgi:hypothetical protein
MPRALPPDMLTVAAMQRALVDLDYCRIGSRLERAEAYAEAGISTSDAERLDAEAWRTERLRRLICPAAPIAARKRRAARVSHNPGRPDHENSVFAGGKHQTPARC